MKDNNKNNNNAFFNNKNSFGMISTNEDNEYAFKNLPMGLSMAFTQNAAALTAFENMDSEKKKEIIEKASRVSSKKEMTELVQNISINNI